MNSFVPSPEQRAIIDYPDVPLRVVAGAGTGKTTTIVERLAAGVARGADPTRALGITFTNKAADELRTRLRAVVGDRPDGREVEVTTYHGFAAAILDEFGAFVGHRADTELMDEGHRSELAYRVLRSLESTDLDLAALPQRRTELLAMADAMNANLLTLDDLTAFAPADPDEVWQKRLALAHAVERYTLAKRRLGFIEFGDMIRFAVQIVETHPGIARQLTERYDTVLLDEYQDTDPAQRRLLTAMFSSVGVAVTAVGDADQTIYEWRGASLDNFVAFPEHFPRPDGRPAETLPLSVNRRSDRVILDMANEIQTLLPRVEASRPLAPRDGAGDGTLEVGWFRSDEEEATWIAEQIAERHRAGSRWADVAILCRKRSAIPVVVHALRAAEIPYAVSSMGELLTVPEVADLLAWLRILADPTDEPSFLRIWMGGMFRIGMRDVARVNRWSKRAGGRGFAVALEHLEDVDDLTDAGRRRLERFRDLYTDLYARAQVASVPQVLATTIQRLGLWDEVAALPRSAAATARVNLGRFTSLVHRWRPLDGTPTLAAFLRYVAALEDASRGEELEAAADTSDDVVQVITAHTAKGLEWPVVFLPSLARGTFPTGVRTYDDPETSPLSLPYPARLDHSAYAEAEKAVSTSDRREILKKRHIDGEWRLAYVAVTRAKHELVMTGHAWDQDVTKPRDPSPLLEMARDLDGSSIVEWVADPGPKPPPSPFSVPVEAPDPLFPDGWSRALSDRLSDEDWISEHHPELVDAVGDRCRQLTLRIESLRTPVPQPAQTRFTTSVTGLVTLSECPLKFKWAHRDRLPRRPRRSASLGTEFHRRVEMHNLGVMPLDRVESGNDTGDDTSPLRHTTPYDDAGDPWRAFEASRFHDMRAVHAEVPFALDLDDGVVRGKIDAIYEHDDGTWEIVDYKSGVRRDDDARSVQLQAYALAVADGAVAGSVPDRMQVTFAFFGGGSCEEVSSTVDERWLAEARNRVVGLVKAADGGPFDPRPSPDCRWCDFLHHCPAGRAASAAEQG